MEEVLLELSLENGLGEGGGALRTVDLSSRRSSWDGV